MKERGIIFNGEMVRATLDGLKTQTRRPVKSSTADVLDLQAKYPHKKYNIGCPFGAIGDRLWVRETWSLLGNEDACPIDWNDNLVKGGGVDAARIYRASCEQKPGDYGLWSIPDDADWKPHTDDMKFEGAWTPSIHMPRWASRITLEITDVRVERLNSISESDALAEGFTSTVQLTESGDDYTGSYPSEKFSNTWQSIYGAENWDANPWVWVIVFKRIKGD